MQSSGHSDGGSGGWAGLSGEVSGAFADLGTLLPYVVAGILGGLLAPVPVLLGFAAGYALAAAVYRAPVPVQPMKALGAALLTGALAPAELAWAGAAIGATLCVLAMLPGLGRAARLIPQSVLAGLQLGLGITLGLFALPMLAQGPVIAAGAAGVLALSAVWPRGPWVLVVVAGAIAGGLLWGAPGAPDLVADRGPVAATDVIFNGILPQLPLTLLNAVALTAALARSRLGPATRVTERRLAATSGLLNLALAPFGAMPMCHGAGGLAAHLRFGARGIGAPLVMAGICLVAALSGPHVVALLAAIPMPVIGTLVAFAAADLALSRRLFDARPDCRPVIGLTAACCALFGPAAGLALGLASEALRIRRKAGRPA